MATAALFAVFLVNFQSGTVLVKAVADGNVELVVKLIDVGHDVNGVGKDDWTPLTAAVENNDSEMVRLLLESGANPNKIVPGGTSLDMAIRRQRNEPAKILREFGGHCSTTCDLE